MYPWFRLSAPKMKNATDSTDFTDLIEVKFVKSVAFFAVPGFTHFYLSPVAPLARWGLSPKCFVSSGLTAGDFQQLLRD